MNYTLFPNHYHISAPQAGSFNNNLGYKGNSYLLPSNIPYSYVQIPSVYYQSCPQRYYGAISYERLDLILIAILVLVSLDLIFVRPSKK